MKITVELKDGTVFVNSDGMVNTGEALECLMASTCETLVNMLKSDVSPQQLDRIFKNFGRAMEEAASARYKQLHGTKRTGITSKEKAFLDALFRS